MRKAAMLNFFCKSSTNIIVGLFEGQMFQNTVSCKTIRLNYSAIFVIYTYI
jgi:hypothetical protein